MAKHRIDSRAVKKPSVDRDSSQTAMKLLVSATVAPERLLIRSKGGGKQFGGASATTQCRCRSRGSLAMLHIAQGLLRCGFAKVAIKVHHNDDCLASPILGLCPSTHRMAGEIELNAGLCLVNSVLCA
jgi:hypothetical protein